MPNDEMENDLRALWQSQSAEGGKMSLEEVRIDARKFQDRIRRRNIREYVAAVITIVIFGLEIWLIKFPPIIVVAIGLWIAAVLSLLYQVHKRGSSRPLPADLALTSCIDFHRLELERQRDSLETFWYWGLLPCVPGFLVLLVAVSFAPRGLVVASIVGAAGVCWFVFFWKLNQRAARRLQRKIDELGG